MILYILFNADLLEISIEPDEDSLGYVDDASAIATADTLEEAAAILKDFMEREGGGFTWSADHNSRFEISKLAVVYYTYGKVLNNSYPTLTLQGTPIERRESYKYLGIHVDQHLRWNTQLKKTIDKAMQWILQFRRFTKPATGISAALMRRLYITVAIPKITYGAEVWYNPPTKQTGKKNRTGSVKALKELTKIQRVATIAINGALCTTPTDLLDPHAGLLPMELLLKKICHRSALRLCSLGPENPASRLTAKYTNQPATRHITSIQHHCQLFKLNPSKIEKIPAALRLKEPKYSAEPAKTKTQAIIDETQDNAPLRAYTDGSRVDGMVGAAAVLFKHGEANPHATARLQLGNDKEHTVAEAELVGGILALSLIRNIQEAKREPTTIYTDSQALLQSLTKTHPQSSAHLIEKLHTAAEDTAAGYTIVGNAPRIIFKWIPGHSKIKGNEIADREAKRAALEGSSPREELPLSLHRKLPANVDALK